MAVCVIPAAGKLLGHPEMRESAARFGIPWRRYRLIAVPELAAAGMTLLLLGALIAHRRAHDRIPDMLTVLVALVIVVAYQAIAYTS